MAESQKPVRKPFRKKAVQVDDARSTGVTRRRRRTGSLPTRLPGFIQGQNRTNKEG